jgi:hypothetical protein
MKIKTIAIAITFNTMCGQVFSMENTMENEYYESRYSKKNLSIQTFSNKEYIEYKANDIKNPKMAAILSFISKNRNFLTEPQNIIDSRLAEEGNLSQFIFASCKIKTVDACPRKKSFKNIPTKNEALRFNNNLFEKKEYTLIFDDKENPSVQLCATVSSSALRDPATNKTFRSDIVTNITSIVK